MEQRIGKIIDSGNAEMEDTETGARERYENPGRIPVENGNDVDYVAIIARTPEGEKVLNILKDIRVKS